MVILYRFLISLYYTKLWSIISFYNTLIKRGPYNADYKIT